MDTSDDEFDMELDMTDVLAAVEQVESRAQTTSNHANSHNHNSNNPITIDDDFDDFDDDLDIEALVHAADVVEKQNTTTSKNQVQSSLSTYYGKSSTNNAVRNIPLSSSRPTLHSNTSNVNIIETSSNGKITFGLPEDMEDPTPPPPPPSDAKTFHPFDGATIPTWIYPTNHPIRGYQFNIVRKALFSNTLVSIPTGLGKTFIASVVMYNYYRWFPNSIMIFMAPTRPLVEQQIKACYDVCGIPQKDTVIMVGTSGKAKRPGLWAKGRIFFCTPQVLDNDLGDGTCPAHKVVLLVVDEAHRATGNYAYTNVIEKLGRIHSQFRVLALSATPGSTVDKVQEVVNNLRINTLEVRTEESMDVQEFSFGKRVQNIVINLKYTSGATGIVPRMTETFCDQVFQPVLDRLAKRNALYGPTVERCSPFILLNERKKYQMDAKNVPTTLKRIVMVDFLLAEALARAYEGLCVYGVGTFVDTLDRFLQSIRTDIEAGKHIPSENYKILNHFGLKQLLDQSRQQMATPGFVGHPKLDSLLNIILRHFNECSGDQQQATDDLTTASSSSRIIVFSSLRASVNMIVDFLSIHQPLIRCSAFIGQAGDAQGSKGMSQKEQQQTIERFKKGYFNVMVATSIGEEGLDIGEVDLIVCYDSQSSSIRLLQRMGRTGRRRKGHCVMLMTEQEERKFKRATDSYKQIQNSISKQNVIKFGDEIASLLPSDYHPVVQRKRLVIGNYLTTMVQGLKRRRNGDNGADFQKDGTLSDQGLETLLATLPGNGLSSLDQAFDRFWPSFHPLKGALKYLSLQQNQNRTKRVGHSHRTTQFAFLMKNMEDRILKGPDDQDGMMQPSQDNDSGNNHVLKLPKRRKPTSNVIINNTDLPYGDIDERARNNNNNELTLPTPRNSRTSTTTIDAAGNDYQQDSDIVEDVLGDTGAVDWSSFMEPLMAKGMADDEDNYDQDYSLDCIQEYQSDCDITMDKESKNGKTTDIIALDSDDNIGDGDGQPTSVPGAEIQQVVLLEDDASDEQPTKASDEKRQQVVLLDDDFGNDFDDIDMDLWDDIERQAIATQQLQNTRGSTSPLLGFLFDDCLPPLISEDEEKRDSLVAHSLPNFSDSFVWTKSKPVFSDQARKNLIQRLQGYNNHHLAVRLLGNHPGPGKSVYSLVTSNSPPPLLSPLAKPPTSYEHDDVDDADLTKLDERIYPITETPTRNQLKYVDPATSEQRMMVESSNSNSNNDNMNSSSKNEVDLTLDNVINDNSTECSITNSQPRLYEMEESPSTPLQPTNVYMKMATQQDACVNNHLNNNNNNNSSSSSDIPNAKSPLSCDESAKEMDCGMDVNSEDSWEINDDTSFHAASMTTPITIASQRDNLHLESPIPAITTPSTPMGTSSRRLMHSTPQNQQLQKQLGVSDFGNQSLYLHSPTNNNSNRSPLRRASTPNENNMKTTGTPISAGLDSDSYDSPIVRRMRSRHAHIILDSDDETGPNSVNQNESYLDTNKDDDTIDKSTKSSSEVENEHSPEPTIPSSDDEPTDNQQHKHKKYQQSKRWAANPFLDNEAEQSDDGVDTSDEDEMEDASNVMDSFIYDGSSELHPDGEGDDGNNSLIMAPQGDTTGSGKQGNDGGSDMAMYRTSLLQRDVATTHGAPPIFASDFRRKTWLDKMETTKWEKVADDDDDDDDEIFHDASDLYSDTILDGPSGDGVTEDISRFTNASDDFM